MPCQMTRGQVKDTIIFSSFLRMQEEARKGEVRQASTNEHKLMSKKELYIYNKMEYNDRDTSVPKKKKYKIAL